MWADKVLKFFAALALGAYIAWIASFFWLWFIVPVLSVPALSFPFAWGTVLLIRLLQLRFPVNDSVPMTWENLTGYGVIASFFWGLGYVVHLLTGV